MKYGLPYKGSKNKLAERIVRFLSQREHLIDLFCGGCAVSHAALLMGKYQHIHINDVNWMCPTLFIDALNGKYNDDTRWISREDFLRLKDTDPYVAVVWSFGNNMRDYLYSKEIEPLKRAIHYAIFFSDYEPGRALGHDLSFVDDITDVQKRYIAVKRYFSQYGHFQQQSLERGADASRARCSDNAAQYHTGGGGRPCGCNTPKPSADSIPTFSPSGGASASVRLEATERRLNISRNITRWNEPRGGGIQSGKMPSKTAIPNIPTTADIQKKIAKRPWEAEHRERTNGIASLAIPRTTTRHACHQGGGANATHHQQCA